MATIKEKTIQLIDALKATCQSYGMGNDGNEYKIIINNFEHNGFYIVEGNIPGIMIGNELGAIFQAANDYVFMPLSPNLIVSKKHITIKKSNNK